MKSYKPDSPAFSGTIQIVETTDPAHADNINAATKQLHDNTICLVTSLTDTDAITKAFESVFSYIGGGGESEQAMDKQDILNAISTEWSGESSENPNALSASDITEAISTEWDGESSENPNALSASEIYQAIENAEKA